MTNMRLLIWGTGKMSRSFFKLDFFSAYEIIGFIDSNKTEESFMGYQVYLPEEVIKLEFDYIVVCVAKNNESILQKCIEEQMELSKIFFTRYEQGFGSVELKYVESLMCEEDALRRFPMIFIKKEAEKQKRNYIDNTFILGQDLKDKSIIDRIGEGHVIAWIPIELIFSEKTADCYLEEYGNVWLEQNAVWENIPLIAFRPYRSLFLFFLNGSQFPKDYCKWFQNLYISRGLNSGLSDEELIEKRYREYRIMQNQLNQGMTFFIKHPATAKWNSRGYFNLTDGHHRTSFLYYSGMIQIPVQITAYDYKLWCNEQAAHAVHDIVLKQKRTEFYQPILNPYFLGINSYRESCAKSRLHHILEYFSEKRFTGKKVIDIGANLGYMGQAFYRMGADVTLVEVDTAHYEMAIKVNELLYSKCRIVTQKFEDYNIEGVYDIAILLTVFYHYFHNDDIRNAFINQLNTHVSQMIIWESGDEYEQEKEFILENTKFKSYRHLCYTYATGKFREFGIFAVDSSEYF